MSSMLAHWTPRHSSLRCNRGVCLVCIAACVCLCFFVRTMPRRDCNPTTRSDITTDHGFVCAQTKTRWLLPTPPPPSPHTDRRCVVYFRIGANEPHTRQLTDLNASHRHKITNTCSYTMLSIIVNAALPPFIQHT